MATDDPTLARAKVPVLEHLDDGSPPLVESLVIAEYLEDRFPVMATRSAEQRAAVRLFVEKFNGAMSYMALLRAEPGSEAETEAKAALAAGMQAMDSFLRAYADSEGPFFFGSTFSLAEEACGLPSYRPDPGRQ